MVEQEDILSNRDFDRYNGKKVKTLWLGDPNWYEGVVEKLEDGTHLIRSRELVGLLEDAHEIQEIG